MTRLIPPPAVPALLLRYIQQQGGHMLALSSLCSGGTRSEVSLPWAFVIISIFLSLSSPSDASPAIQAGMDSA